MSEKQEETFAYAMQLVLGSVLPMAMQAAIDLGIFEIIAKAGDGAKLSASEVVAQMPTCSNPDAPMMLDRILRLLVSHSVLACSVINQERFYSLAPVSEYFVCNKDGVSLGALMALSHDKIYLESWPQLKDAVLQGGIPFNTVHGMHACEYPRCDSRFNEVFNTAMFNQTTIVINRILECYNGFAQLKQLVDVGGGLGVTLKVITSKYPHIRGINFDLPHVTQHAPSYPGVEHLGGDMFESVPKRDAIFMKWILHDWSDEYCLKLLKNCYNATPVDGKLIVVEVLVQVMPEATAVAKSTSQIDVLMMAQYPGGKEPTREEFMALATGAGFRGIRFECFVCNYCIMEFFK